MADTQDPRDWTAGRILRRAILDRPRDVTLGSILLMSHQAGEAMVPLVLGQAIDRAIAPGEWPSLAVWIGLLAAAFLSLSLAWRYGHRVAVRVQEQASHDLRLLVARRVMHPRGGLSSNRMPGELLNIATADARVAGSVAALITTIAAASAALLVASAILLRVSPGLGLLILIGLPPIVGVLYLVGRPLEERASQEQAQAARAAGIATDLVSGLRVLKGIGAEQAGARRYLRASDTSRGAAVRAARWFAVYEAAAILLVGGFLAFVAYLGGRLALAGDISIGELIAAVGLAQFLIGPFTRLAYGGAELARARASAGRIAGVLATPYAVRGGRVPLATPAGTVAFEGVTYGSLRNLSLRVGSGETVSIVAPEVTDAHALVRLLAQDASPAHGRILLDGVPLQAIDLEAARAAMVVAPHDAAIFAGSLRESFAPWSPTAETLDRIAVATAANEVAEALPDGWDSHVTERGRSLSGGQRQRIALARALAADPPVLVLHDPTTAVDSVTEARIAAGLPSARTGRTTIMLTTSPALLAASDRVVFVRNGEAVAEGSHDRLSRTVPGYREAIQ